MMRYATFAPVNLLMAISFVAVGFMFIANIRSKRREGIPQ